MILGPRASEKETQATFTTENHKRKKGDLTDENDLAPSSTTFHNLFRDAVFYLRIADHSPDPASLVVESEGELGLHKECGREPGMGGERALDDRNADDGMMPPHCPETNSSGTMPPIPVTRTLLSGRRHRPNSV